MARQLKSMHEITSFGKVTNEIIPALPESWHIFFHKSDQNYQYQISDLIVFNDHKSGDYFLPHDDDNDCAVACIEDVLLELAQFMKTTPPNDPVFVQPKDGKQVIRQKGKQARKINFGYTSSESMGTRDDVTRCPRPARHKQTDMNFGVTPETRTDESFTFHALLRLASDILQNKTDIPWLDGGRIIFNEDRVQDFSGEDGTLIEAGSAILQYLEGTARHSDDNNGDPTDPHRSWVMTWVMDLGDGFTVALIFYQRKSIDSYFASVDKAEILARYLIEQIDRCPPSKRRFTPASMDELPPPKRTRLNQEETKKFPTEDQFRNSEPNMESISFQTLPAVCLTTLIHCLGLSFWDSFSLFVACVTSRTTTAKAMCKTTLRWLDTNEHSRSRRDKLPWGKDTNYDIGYRFQESLFEFEETKSFADKI